MSIRHHRSSKSTIVCRRGNGRRRKRKKRGRGGDKLAVRKNSVMDDYLIYQKVVWVSAAPNVVIMMSGR